jgi:hypothetical protein
MVGVDPWVGCSNENKLPKILFKSIQERSMFILNQFVDEQATSLRQQGCIRVDRLGILREEVEIWNAYIDSPLRIHFKIRRTHWFGQRIRNWDITRQN